MEALGLPSSKRDPEKRMSSELNTPFWLLGAFEASSSSCITRVRRLVETQGRMTPEKTANRRIFSHYARAKNVGDPSANFKDDVLDETLKEARA